MPIRVLIVDDEALARRGLRARLRKYESLVIVGEAANGLSAVDAIDALAPDIILLDVQMPGLDGFGVVEAVGKNRMPVVVFVTAHDDHAIRAFDADAIDYVLKPIESARLARAMDRAIGRVLQQRAAAGQPVSLVSAGSAARPESVERFIVSMAGRRLVIPTDDIEWISADGDYARLHVGRQSYLYRETMARLEAQLDPSQFVRVHRSTIVAMRQISELHPQANREFIIVLKNGIRVKLSRSFRGRLDTHFGR